MPFSRPQSETNSRGVRYGYTYGFSGRNPTEPIASGLGIGCPSNDALPLVGEMRPVSILIVVVLPAPFGPRKPKISPRFTVKLTPRTASTFFPENGFLKVFASLSTTSTGL